MSSTLKSILIILVILVIDQVLKFIIKTNMSLYEQIPVFGDWFIIHFVENRGMAFGMNLPGDYGKIILSIFRLIAIVAIAFYLRHLIRLQAPTGLVVTLSMIMAGAIGNMIDSAFYGLIFNESTPYQVATLFPGGVYPTWIPWAGGQSFVFFWPVGGGYDTFLHGKVVDMFYFPLITGVYPTWIPWVGGESFVFFRPVFNIADASISVAVVILLFNQKRFFKHMEHPGKTDGEQSVAGESTEDVE